MIVYIYYIAYITPNSNLNSFYFFKFFYQKGNVRNINMVHG
jgi:hypothetical protein